MSERAISAVSAPVIECIDVHKRFGAVEALRGVDLTVDAGELVAVSGPSGCGKSTLLHLMAALDRPTSGRIVVNGHDLAHLRAPNRFRREDVGIIFQLHNLLAHLTARQNVELAMFGTDRKARERSRRAAELLTDLGLAHAIDRTPSRLSGGERQRVAIARALVNEPPVILADEPTGSLDPVSVQTFFELLARLRDTRQTTIVMVTHDPVATAHADRHLTIDDGRLPSDLEDTRTGAPPGTPPAR